MKTISAALFRISSAMSANAIRLIMSDCGYGAYLSHRTNDLSKVSTLLAIAERRRGQSDFVDRLSQLRDIVMSGGCGGGIILSTIHSAKGMEFDRVIICDAKNGILPSVFEPSAGKYTDEELASREEDRRLFYVAVTRAKERLALVTYDSEFGKKTDGFDFIATLLCRKRREARRGASARGKGDGEARSRVLRGRRHLAQGLRRGCYFVNQRRPRRGEIL